MKLFFAIIILALCNRLIQCDQFLTFRGPAFYSDLRYPFQNHKSRRLVCISDNPDDPIIWNTNLEWAYTDLAYKDREILTSSILSNPATNNLGINCRFNNKFDLCFNKWTAANNTWSVIRSLNEHMGPVFDSRWEEFKEVTTFEISEDKFKYVTKFIGNGSIAISIRGSSNAHFLLCKSRNYTSDFCYWLAVGAYKNNITGVRKCEKGVRDGKYPSFDPDCVIFNKAALNHTPLDKDEWRTFVISWTEATKSIEIFNPYKLIYQYTDNSSAVETDPYYLFFSNPNDDVPKLYRIHDYYYTYTKKTDVKLTSAALDLSNSTSICIDLIIGLCSQCHLHVHLIDGHNISIKFISISRNVIAKKADYDIPMWGKARIELSNVTLYLEPIRLLIVTRAVGDYDSQKYHWALSEIRECYSSGTVKSTSTVATQDYKNKYFWPKVTCQKLSYGNENVMLIDPDRPADAVYEVKNASEICSKGFFGPNCVMHCDASFMSSDCHSVIMCDDYKCYCTQGFTGETCDFTCGMRSYGYGCSEYCGNCALKYNLVSTCDRFTGKCNGCQYFLDKYLIPPFCKIEINKPQAPTIENKMEDSALLYIQMPNNSNYINVSFTFELRTADFNTLYNQQAEESSIESPEILTATFLNLSPGVFYNVRLLLHITDNTLSSPYRTLAGDWASFITSCTEAAEYTITPNETSLKIEKFDNSKISHHCPDTWYNVQLFSLYPHKLHASSKFPVEFIGLTPDTKFEVIISGLNEHQCFRQIINTLEAAPSKVVTLRTTSVDANQVKITWSPPALPNGIIRGYNITVTLGYAKGCVNEGVQPVDQNLHIKTIDDISPGATSYAIDLLPYKQYYITVSAYNSKPGAVSTLNVSTQPLDIPTEQFINLQFFNHSSKIYWEDPDCTLATGPIRGARLFITGVSFHVKNFTDSGDTKWHTFELNVTKPQDIHGLEIYNVRVFVLRNLYSKNYNESSYCELNFTTPPSPPPKVRNVEIVEVDEENGRTTLRWQKPLPPTNGEIIGYNITFPSRSRSRTVQVTNDEICPLWTDWFCKIVNRRGISSEYIQVAARNEGVERLGDPVQIQNHIKVEKGPDKPEIEKPNITKNSVVDFHWKHPWKTRCRMEKFRIKHEIMKSDLRILPKDVNDIPYTEVPINGPYKKRYGTRLFLLPSTFYAIHIQGVCNNFEGEPETINITTPLSIGFGSVKKPVVNDKGAQIDIFIPSVLNETNKAIIHIIVIGTIPCKESSLVTSLPDLIGKFELKSYETAWRVAKFSTSEYQANQLFTIGDGKIHKDDANCALLPGSYQVVFIVEEDHLTFEKEGPYIRKNLEAVQVGPVIKKADSVWAVPLAILLIITAVGIACYYLRRRLKSVMNKAKESSTDVSLPIIPQRKVARSSSRQSQLLVENRQSIEAQCDSIEDSDIPPIDTNIKKDKHPTSLVKLNEFQDYVKNAIRSGKLVEEYKIFPRGQTKPWEYGKLPENKMKNRYINLIAYDDTRVILDKLPDEPYSDYINANYIKGYKKNKAYIATQGPKPSTVNDFWRMIWQEQVQVICMLANIMEGGKKKCEQYWPEIGKEATFGNITVGNINHTTFADYTFRIFSVTCDQQCRKIEQLHYTAWPDHGIPLYTQSVVSYLKKLLATPVGAGPIVVHCSAGIGRTGTIILCDICLRRAAAEGVVDVFTETQSIRNQRANMVDNHQQYLLAHLALVECLLTLPTAIPCNEALPVRIQEYKNQLSLQKQRLDDTVWQDDALQGVSRKPVEISIKNIAKNRYPELAAAVGPKLYISRYPTTDDDSNYMFGTYVDSARRRNNYIASQLPLPSTVHDFWRMVAEFQVELVIVLQPPDSNDPTCCEFIPEHDEEIKPTPTLTFKGRHVINEEICTSRKIILTDTSENPTKVQPITVLTLKGWEPGEKKPPPKPITLVDFWQYAERISRGEGPTVVLCHDGVTNCGLYLALSFILERMGLERECDVCLAIRAIRRSRPDFCQDLEQFEYLYDAAVIYADYFEMYANFT